MSYEHFPSDGDSGASSQPAAGFAELGLGGTVALASLGARLGARLLDGLIVGVGVAALAVFSGVASFAGTGADAATNPIQDTGSALDFVSATILSLVITGLYEVTQIALWGQTIGKRAVRIKVVHAMTGEVPGWGSAAGRWSLPGLVSVIPWYGWLASLLCYVSCTWDRSRQGWHDKVAKTLVVKNAVGNVG